jgi:hypothetical protein
MKVLKIEPVHPAWMRLHNTIKYSGFPEGEIRNAIATGAIRAFTLRSQYHRKLKGPRDLWILVNVESLDRFIEAKEKESIVAEQAGAFGELVGSGGGIGGQKS